MATATYDRVRHLIPEFEWAVHEPLIEAINRLKQEKNAVLLAHNYQTPEIYHGVADYTGDSLGLAREAAQQSADVIVFCGVHFMAETAAVLNPGRTVLIPDPNAGCSLAEAITGEDVRNLKQQYPGVPVVAYVNTSADVKAEVDVCCTSSNAIEVVESLDSQKVIFLPDKYLAHYVARHTDKEIIPWDGRCIVHEEFKAQDIRDYRAQFPGLTVIAHPECPPDVIDEADHVGSTSGMVSYIKKHRPKQVAMITECSMSDNVAVEFPDVEFVRPCSMCPHMKRITLQKIKHSLETMTHKVEVPPDIAQRARRSVERMLEVGRGQGG